MRRKNGEGTINEGYRVFGKMIPGTRKCKRITEQRLVWEREKGPIPEGLLIHHINADKLDNRIENLQLVDIRTHQRLHAGWRCIDGQWYLQCTACQRELPLLPEYWYLYRDLDYAKPISRRCRACSRNQRKKRRMEAYTKAGQLTLFP